MTNTKGWEIVKRFERGRLRDKYKDLTPTQRLEIYEDLYRAAMKIAPEKLTHPWPGDDNWHKIPHLRHLIETRKLLNSLIKR